MRVLVVDDDAPTRGILDRVLSASRQVDHVAHAATAEEATALAEALVPDVVLLDLLLGGQDGRDLIAALRLAAPDARVVVLTVLAARDAEESSLAAGAHAFRTKSAELYVRLAEEVQELATLTSEDG